MNRKASRSALSALAAALTLALAACGGSGGHDMSAMTTTVTTIATTGTASGGVNDDPGASGHNAADVTFASEMIPHHGQAVAMADLALETAVSQDVKELANQIKAAQDPEIQTMSGWLRGWGAPVPDAQAMHHGEGMMSMEQMDRLEEATGAQFDRLWLEMMVEHHEGAIAMARTELTSGASPQAKKLAQAIIDGQAKEIATMKALLAQGG